MEATYLQLIGEAFGAAKAGIDARLEDRGQAPLVDWFRGQPVKLRQENTPYAWYELPEAIGGEVTAFDDDSFEVPVTVGLVVSANNPAELLDWIEQLGPVIQAAVEALPCPYLILSGGVRPGPRIAAGGVCRAVDLPFIIRGQRARGEVA